MASCSWCCALARRWYSTMIPWHRLFGMILDDFCADTRYKVVVEKDLSRRRQFLDVVVVKLPKGAALRDELEDPPDGLDDLGAHNLITFKSFRESLTAWAMDELLGHFVNYRKQWQWDKGELIPLAAFRLIAVTARFPEDLASRVQFVRRVEGVYNVVWGSQRVRVVVLNQVRAVPRNALWGLFSGKADRIWQGRLAYRWKRPHTSTIIKYLYENYEAEGVEMPFTREDFHRIVLDDAVKMFPPSEILSKFSPEEVRRSITVEQIRRWFPLEELLKGVPAEERLKGVPAEERLKGIPAEERLKGLTPREIEGLLRRLKDAQKP